MPVRILSAVDELPAASWNDAVDRLGGQVHHRHEWLTALERSGPVDVEPRHAALTDAAGRLVGLAPCYLTRSCPKLDMFRRHYLTSPLGAEPLAVVHSMYGQTSQVLAATEAEREQLVAALEDAVDAPLAFPLVPAGDPLLPLLADRGYDIGLLSCTNLLPVRWPSFQAYLADRPSAKRHNISRGLRRSDEAGVWLTVRRGAAAGADLELLAGLAAGTAAHHGSPVFFDERFLTGIVRELGEAVVVFTVRAGAAPLLSCLALEHAGELSPWCVGLEYSGLDTFDHYNYLYAALIRHAIEIGLASVNFGRSTYLIKRKFGCLQRPVRIAVRPAAGTADWVRDIDERARAELAALGLSERAA